MMRRSIAYLAAALFVLAASPVAAHEKAETARVAITRADCARLVAHLPAPDVAYQPGVDVHGREVVPADLGGAPRIELPETILIDIEIDLLERFGIPADPTLYDPDAEVGEVAYRDGRFTFNGQPLQDEAQAELAARCQRIVPRGRG
jgi:hypothetical protein